MAKAADPRIGSVLQGRYRIIERLASGGMGVVYRGERLNLERAVAIKFLHGGAMSDAHAMKRFEREARVMGRLGHPNCVSVIDVGIDETPYIVMEFVVGETLQEIRGDGRMPVYRTLRVMRQVLSGLAHAHACGVIHRDVKPANIMIADVEGIYDHVWVLDFGLAKFLQRVQGDDLTASSVVIGTPSYMSPEQARGDELSVASDVYSTGVVLLEAITGVNPFRADSALDTLNRHQNERVPALAELAPSVRFPDGLEDALRTALAKDIEQRYETAVAFADALDELLERGERALSGPVEAPAIDLDGSALDAVVVDAVAAGVTDKAEVAVVEIAPSGVGRVDTAAADDDEAGGGDAGEGLGGEAAEVGDGEEEPAGNDTVSLSPTHPPPRRAFDTVVTPLPEMVDTTEPTQRRESRGWAALLVLLLPVGAALGTWYALSRGGGDAVDTGATDAAIATADVRPPDGVRVPDTNSARDAGARRAGPPDAGPPDARPPDARPPDAETPDAEPPDAGAIDATVEIVTAPPPQPSQPSSVETIRDVVRLIQAGRRDEAIAGIHKIKPRNKNSAYLPFLLGNLYFEKMYWGDGLDAYREAIAKNRVYAKKAILCQNAVRALSSDKTVKKANLLFLRFIRRDGLSYLRRAARSDPSVVVRRRATWLIQRLAK